MIARIHIFELHSADFPPPCRLKMMNSKLFRRNALKKSTPIGIYGLVLKRYWKTLIGTAGTWFL